MCLQKNLVLSRVVVPISTVEGVWMHPCFALDQLCMSEVHLSAVAA